VKLDNLSVPKEQSWLSWFFRGLLILGILVMLGRLAELQVIKGAYYRELAEGNRIRRVPIVAPRGKILDTNGIVLVDNELVEKTAKFDPMEGYTKELANENTPEDEVISEWQRKYVYGADLAHVAGYLGEVNEGEVNKVDPNCSEKGPHALGSFVGRVGLEQFYDCQLRGIDGEELIEVDTVGRRIRSLGRKQPIPGEDIKTTIDYKLQKKLADSMNGKPGSAVVSTPTGEILALYSSPSFDPNLFIKKDSKEEVAKLLSDESLPMFNRFLGGIYHPGSVYKIVTTVAAVEEGKIDREFTYEDTGAIRINEFEYTNWYLTQYGKVEGLVDPVRALARSTDTFFYEVGDLIGAQKLSEWSKRFGLAEKTGIDLPGEVTGLVPSPEWKKATLGERWFLGNTYNMAIGQGDLAVTLLGNHRLGMAMANGGQICTLSIAGEARCQSLGLQSESLSIVRDGMKAACDAGGTGPPFFNFLPEVGCKTGTAETSIKGETHAWFTVFAPFENPQYVVTVLVEKGGEGSKVAAPVARELMDFIFNP